MKRTIPEKTTMYCDRCDMVIDDFRVPFRRAIVHVTEHKLDYWRNGMAFEHPDRDLCDVCFCDLMAWMRDKPDREKKTNCDLEEYINEREKKDPGFTQMVKDKKPEDSE